MFEVNLLHVSLAFLLGVFLSLVATKLLNNPFAIPRIRIVRSTNGQYEAKIRGMYSYTGKGDTREVAIGRLVILIDKLKHKGKRIVQ
jgi:hypothetical protein